MRCHLFIDEVGNGDLNGSAHIDNERYLSLTGIITRLDLYENRFIPELRAFKAEIFGAEIGPSVILHRREIMRKEGVFAVLRDPDLRARFDDGLLRLFRELPYLLTTIVIDKREHLETYGVWHFDPYHYCLRALVERYVLWMRRRQHQGDVITEPRNRTPDKKVKASFARIYEHGTEHISAAIIQAHLTSKEVKFSPKRNNCPAMQICDMLAYPSFKGMKHERLGGEVPDDYGRRIFEVLNQWKYARNPTTHVLTGWGKKWLPK